MAHGRLDYGIVYPCGIELRMRYRVAKPGGYKVVLVGAGTNVEISVNGGPLVPVRLANRDLTTFSLKI